MCEGHARLRAFRCGARRSFSASGSELRSRSTSCSPSGRSVEPIVTRVSTRQPRGFELRLKLGDARRVPRACATCWAARAAAAARGCQVVTKNSARGPSAELAVEAAVVPKWCAREDKRTNAAHAMRDAPPRATLNAPQSSKTVASGGVVTEVEAHRSSVRRRRPRSWPSRAYVKCRT